jgi:pimeloyl-ACP methyl ester carboxylesterase
LSAIDSAAGFVRFTRDALAAAGFVREERGGTCVWSGGHSDAPPILLLHGANDQAGTWFAVAPALARTRRVIVPDLPGHGESKPFEGPLPISLLIARLNTDVIVPRQAVVVGNSLGGWLAMLLALEHPETVSRLILEDSGGLSRPIASPLTAGNREQALVILRNVHGPEYEPPEWVIEALLERAKNAPMLRITESEKYFVDSRLREISVPTSIVWGEHDRVVPLSYGEELRDGIRGAELHVIEGAGHIPHMQQPERFLACLTSIF